MKTLIILLIPIFSFAQAPKGANTVIVPTKFDSAIFSLLNQGVQFDKLDKDFQYAHTDWMPFCQDCAPEYRLSVYVKKDTAYITGEWRTNSGISLKGPRTSLNSARAYSYTISNEGPKIARMAFELMEKYALSLNSKINYR